MQAVPGNIEAMEDQAGRRKKTKKKEEKRFAQNEQDADRDTPAAQDSMQD